MQDLLRQALLSNAQTEGPKREESTETSGDDHFDPNHLLAHVQAVKAVEESDSNEEQGKRTKAIPERTTQKAGVDILQKKDDFVRGILGVLQGKIFSF